MKVLIIGNGFIGSRCAREWPEAVLCGKKINSVEYALNILDEYQPDTVLNAAGVRGQPNVDWCETHQMDTIFGNTVLPILLANACQQRGVYLLHIGSGCVYYGKSLDGQCWGEEDFANPSAVYSRTKYAADLCLSTLPNVGVARIRVPTDYVSSPGNLIDKIAGFKKVIDVSNSITIIEDMVSVFRQLLEKKAEGIFHVTNPGAISYKRVAELYKEMVNPNYTCEWISEEDLVSQGLTQKKRSTNCLFSKNLAKYGITMRPTEEAMIDTMRKYKARLT